MKGIILQDLLSMKRVLKMYMLVLGVYVIIGVSSGSASNFGAFFILFAAMLPMSAFAYRERSHWDLYANVMPVSRKQMVLSSYIFAWMLLAVAGLANLLLIGLDYIAGNFTEAGSMYEALTSSWVILLAGVAYMGLFLPLIYQFGTERSRLLIIGSYIIPFIIVMIVSKNEDLQSKLVMSQQMANRLIFVGAPAFVIAWNMISLHISMRIYEKKDLA